MTTAPPAGLPETTDEGIGIAAMAELSGFSQDTLRWYEREGLLPSVERSTDGRRVYDNRAAATVLLLAKLRATGMPTADMRRFVELMAQGAETHGRRVALLELHRERIRNRQARLADAMEALDAKVDHYHELIEAGLDCDGAPMTEAARRRQRDTAE